MERVSLPELELSRLIYGLWRLGDDKDTSVAHIQAKVESCLEQGITSFDQADIYGDYESEKLLGTAIKALPALREKMEIITKCDIMLLSEKYPDRRVKFYDTTAAHLNMSVDNSLSNMNIEQIDLLLLHRPDPLMDAAETGAALDTLVKSGKVRAIGVSNFRPFDWELLQSNMNSQLQTNQVELSLLATDAFTNGDLAYMQQHKIAPMAWSPLAGGQLFSKDKNELLVKLHQRLDQIAKEQNVGIDAVAVAWLLLHPANILPVLGTNSLERIATMSDAMRVQLDRETWYELYTLACGQEVP